MRLALVSHPEWLELRPLEWLGEAGFAEFRRVARAHDAATRRLPSGEWETAVPEYRALSATRALASAGFVLEPDASAEELLRRSAARERALVAGDDSRFQALETASGGRMRLYQREAALWLRERRRALLADPLGSGKTWSVLAALEGQPALVVCPAAARGVWELETRRCRPDYRVSPLSGRGSFRWPVGAELVVTGYDVLPDYFPVAPAPAGTVVVLDEAHYCKSFKAARSVAARLVAWLARHGGGSTWAVTSTPLLNEPLELWAVLSLAGLQHDVFGTWEEFLRVMGGKKLPHGGYWWGEPLPEARSMLARGMLRRTREDLMPELPPVTRRVLATDELPRAEGDEVRDVEARIAAAGLWETPDVLPLFAGFSRARELLAASKIPVLLALAAEHEDAGEPLVVFSAHRAPVEALARREGWGAILGEVSAAERARLVAALQAGELRGLAGTIGAMGTSVTLTRAAHVVFVDRDFTPARNDQAEGRLCRIGQGQKVLVTDLLAPHELDRRVHDILREKRELLGSVL